MTNKIKHAHISYLKLISRTALWQEVNVVVFPPEGPGSIPDIILINASSLSHPSNIIQNNIKEIRKSYLTNVKIVLMKCAFFFSETIR